MSDEPAGRPVGRGVWYSERSVMSPIGLAALGLVVAVAIAAAVVRAARRSLLARIRAEWGQPVDRPRKLDAIAASHRSRASLPGADGSLDDRTWADLDLDQVFAALDRTQSTLGQHALYHRLRTAPAGGRLDVFEALVNRMSADVEARERAQMALARLQDPHGYDLWWLAGPGGIETRPWYAIFPLLTAATLSVVVLAFLQPGMAPALFAMLGLNRRRSFRDRRPHRRARGGVPTARAGHHGGRVAAVSRGGRHRAVAGPLRAAVPRLRRLKTISRWVSGNPFMLPFNPNGLASALSDVVRTAYEYLNLLFLLDANGVYFGAKELRRDGASLVRLISEMGEIDAAISVASYRAGRNDWCRPRVCGARRARRADRRPAPAPRRGRAEHDHAQPVTRRARHRLEHVGQVHVSPHGRRRRGHGADDHTCLAAEYHAPIFQRPELHRPVRRSCWPARATTSSKSRPLLGLVRASADPDPHLFLLDELFRGTNAVERIAAGQAVLRELIGGGAAAKPHIAIAATHDGELVDLLRETFEAYHFGDSVGPDGLVFSHRLQPGPATTRNAIALLRLHGAPDRVLSRAMSCAAEFGSPTGHDARRAIERSGRVRLKPDATGHGPAKAGRHWTWSG